MKVISINDIARGRVTKVQHVDTQRLEMLADAAVSLTRKVHHTVASIMRAAAADAAPAPQRKQQLMVLRTYESQPIDPANGLYRMRYTGPRATDWFTVQRVDPQPQ